MFMFPKQISNTITTRHTVMGLKYVLLRYLPELSLFLRISPRIKYLKALKRKLLYIVDLKRDLDCFLNAFNSN